MLNKKLETALNKQVTIEGSASQGYLAMACWCDEKGLEGAANFFFRQSDEERMHMLKIVHYIAEAGGKVSIQAFDKPKASFKNILDVVKTAYKQEQAVTKSINAIVDLAIQNKDHQTNSFFQWFVDEQLEEEGMFRGFIDKINLIGLEGRGLYMIDQLLGEFEPED